MTQRDKKANETRLYRDSPESGSERRARGKIGEELKMEKRGRGRKKKMKSDRNQLDLRAKPELPV